MADYDGGTPLTEHDDWQKVEESRSTKRVIDRGTVVLSLCPPQELIVGRRALGQRIPANNNKWWELISSLERKLPAMIILLQHSEISGS